MSRRGSTTVETILFLPLLLLLLMGTIELGRLTYTYYSIYKMLYALARQAGTAQGANFCDEEDSVLQSVKNFVLTGTQEAGGEPLIRELTPDRVQIRIERYNPETGELAECQCGVPGCDTAQGGLAPDSIVVTLPDGYPFQLRIPYLNLSPILLRPQVRVPFGGL